MSELKFDKLGIKYYSELENYFSLRPSKMCEGQVINQIIWGEYTATEIAIIKDKIMLIKIKVGNQEAAYMPKCRIEDSAEAFFTMGKYFNGVMNKKMIMYGVDEPFLEQIADKIEGYRVEEMTDSFDYIYDADKLRTLSGKKYHKKKNHVNAFLKEYEGRFEYKRLCCKYAEDILKLLERWNNNKESEDVFKRLDNEKKGIQTILDYCYELKQKMCGVYIDGQLEAFSIGSYQEANKMATIHIEKANPEIRGLYPYINQQFLINEFEDAIIVNREDDMGLPSLRKAKQSYQPISMVKKYLIAQV